MECFALLFQPPFAGPNLIRFVGLSLHQRFLSLRRVVTQPAPLAYPNSFGYIIIHQGVGDNYFLPVSKRICKDDKVQ